MKKAVPALVGVPVLLVLLLVSACGGGDGDKPSAADTTIAKAIAKALSTPADSVLTAEQATCVADKFVAEVGSAKLKTRKVVGADDAYQPNGANVDAKTSAAYAEALLSCTDEKKLLAAYEKTLTTAFTASSTGVLKPDDVACFSTQFVEDAGVERLLASRVITDTGAFNQTGATMDAKTATFYADAFLGCVDFRKVQAAALAKSDKKIDVGKLEACLKRTKTEDEIRAVIVSAQTQAPDAAELSAASNKKDEACAKEAKK